MSAHMLELIKIGNELGCKGNELQVFVKEHQALARYERRGERAFEKGKVELVAKVVRKRTEEETRRASSKICFRKRKSLI